MVLPWRRPVIPLLRGVVKVQRRFHGDSLTRNSRRISERFARRTAIFDYRVKRSLATVRTSSSLSVYSQLSWLDSPGPEYILSALGPSGARSLKQLYVDCPTLPTQLNEQMNRPLGVDLSHCTTLRDLWVSIQDPFNACPDAFASVLASWAPAASVDRGRGRTLTLTPTFESDFTRTQFVDVLRVFGPVAERTLLNSEDHPHSAEVDICICVIERAEKRAWWEETVACECFPRTHPHGRVRAAFSKSELPGALLWFIFSWLTFRAWIGYWDDCVWSEDQSAGVVDGPSANTDSDAGLHPTPDVPATPDTLDTPPPEEDVLQLVAEDQDETQTAAGMADRLSVLRPPRKTRRPRSRSLKVCGQPSVCSLRCTVTNRHSCTVQVLSGLVLARITKVLHALVRRTI